MRRPKLNLDQQIAHMKDEKGILFNIVTETDARIFLTNSNYYFKLKAFAKNYDHYVTGERRGQYINLEFAYLQELSTMDMHLRKFIIKMTLDIEHFLKVRLLNDVMNNPAENGYDIVQAWLQGNTNVKRELCKKKNNAICSELIQKYEPDFAIWNIVEVLSFGDFASLYYYYYKQNPGKQTMHNLVFPIKCLRNAAAHNNCLLNTLKKPYNLKRRTEELFQYVGKIPGLPRPLRLRMMSNPVIHDFVCMLYVFRNIVSSEMVRLHTMKELHELINERFIRNSRYFKESLEIKESYRFMKIVVDHFVNLEYH